MNLCPIARILRDESLLLPSSTTTHRCARHLNLLGSLRAVVFRRPGGYSENSETLRGPVGYEDLGTLLCGAWLQSDMKRFFSARVRLGNGLFSGRPI